MNELKTWENLIEAFRAYRNDIYIFIYYRSNFSKDFSEDVVQETFEKAWLKRSLFKGGNLKNWLFTIAFNIAKDNFRKENKNVTLIEDNFSKEDSETELYRSYILNALKKLKEDEKDLIILRYILEYSYAQIAIIYSKNETNIRVATHRAFNKLKTIANENTK